MKLVFGLVVGMFLLMATRAEAADPVTITVINQAQGAGDRTFNFLVSTQPAFSLKHGGVKTFTLPAGSYRVAEVGSGGWKLAGITCYTAGTLQDTGHTDGDIVVTLQPGQGANCIFTNTPPSFGSASGGGSGVISVPTATPKPTSTPVATVVSQVAGARVTAPQQAPRAASPVITPPRTGDGGLR